MSSTPSDTPPPSAPAVNNPPSPPPSPEPATDPTRVPLPVLRTDLNDAAIRDRLMKLAKQGEFPGYDPKPDDGVFLADAQGTPFDYDLIGRTSTGAAGRVLTMEMRLRRKLPVVFLIVLVFTIWPGLPVTDSLLVTYFRWYERLVDGWFSTWMWYLPLTVLPAPWMWKGWMDKSRSSATEHAHLQAERIRGALGAAVVEGHSTP